MSCSSVRPPRGRVCPGDERAAARRTSRAVRPAGLRSSTNHPAPSNGGPMKYALLIYGAPAADDAPRELDPAIAAVLDGPGVIDWTRLHAIDSATTVRRPEGGGRLLTDGPFVDSKEYLGG